MSLFVTKNYKHRGMLLEKIINQTIDYYNENKIGFFAKKNLDIKFKSVDRKEKVQTLQEAILFKKSTVDYYGIYQGQYITFEAKSTEGDIFYLSNIKQHQHQHLINISSLGGKTFYILLFKKYSSFFLIEASNIDFSTMKSIRYEEADSIGKKMDIIFPGIIDFLSYL